MNLESIVVGGLTTLVLAMSAIIWGVINSFIDNDKSWKEKHSTQMSNINDNLTDKIDDIEKTVVKELATALQESGGHMAKNIQMYNKQLEDISILTKELGQIKYKIDDLDPGKVELLETRVKTMYDVMKVLVNNKKKS